MRAQKSVRHLRLFALLIVSAVGLAGCANPVDLNAEPGAANGCEAPTADLLVPEAPMLPGRHCMACHTPGGQADYAWTAAGTVFKSPTGPCNSAGLEGVKVEIADENRKILITLFTNRTGNFYTSENIDFSHVRVRISKDGLTKEMQTVQASADCPSCHSPTGAAGAYIYLN